MKNLYDMVVEAVTALNDGFSAHNVTQWVRQMAHLANQNGEDLDLPLSNDPAFKWEVSHGLVKQIMEKLYRARAVDRTFDSSGYFVYHVVAAAPVPPLVATASPAPSNPTSPLVNKIINYVSGYVTRNGYPPTTKEIQSRLKRDCNMSCADLIALARSNGIPVNLGATPSVSTIG